MKAQSSRTRIVLGILLILAGGFFLAQQIFPGLREFLYIEWTWPTLIIAAGVLFLVLGLLTSAPGLAVPAAIVGGIGGLLYWQNATGNWDSWAYAWALIPGFVGVGVILEGLLSGRFREGLSGGGTLVLISLVLFTIFASLFGSSQVGGLFWPILLILLGLWILVRRLFRR